VWFVTGNQHLYGPKTLETVAEHSRAIAAQLAASAHVPTQVDEFKDKLRWNDLSYQFGKPR